MCKFVNSFNLSSDVKLLNLGVEVYDSGVLFVTSEDELRFFRPVKKIRIFLRKAASKLTCQGGKYHQWSK